MEITDGTAPTAHVHDVVVVGARCAGAATAMLLARLGRDVVLVDRATFPSDTVSTHAISRSGVVQLHRWGLLGAVLESGAPAIRQVSFHHSGSTTTKSIKDSAGVDLLVAPRRRVLDTILLEAATASGAEARTGFTITDVVRDGAEPFGGVIGRAADGGATTLRSRFVVGADGLHSRVARAVQAPLVDERHHNGAVHYAYFAGLDWSGIEFHLGDGIFAGAFPTHDAEANVWISGRTDTIGSLGRGDERARRFLELAGRASPEFARRLRGGRRTSPVQGFAGMPNQLRQPVGPGWALVGDAGYFRDAVAGHGISDAFRDAESLATWLDRALRGEIDDRDALTGYQTDRDRDVAELFDITCRLADHPPVDQFVQLQKRLSRVIDGEARRLAERPLLVAPADARAA
jgi:2-polyprenyl-6-methoxyphenol hydroxylase-like FAD-dependent oxidoreductase